MILIQIGRCADCVYLFSPECEHRICQELLCRVRKQLDEISATSLILRPATALKRVPGYYINLSTTSNDSDLITALITTEIIRNPAYRKLEIIVKEGGESDDNGTGYLP